MEQTILSLPNEIISHIFSFLAQSDLVACFEICKNWDLIAMESEHWKETNLALHNCRSTNILQRILNNMSDKLVWLELTGSNLFMSSDKLSLIEFHFPKLQVLDLSFTDIVSQTLFHLMSKLDLTKLLLKGCINVSDHFFFLIKQKSQSRRPKLENFRLIDIGETSCSTESLIILLEKSLFPDLDVIDMNGLPFYFNDLKEICQVHPSLLYFPGEESHFLQGMPKRLRESTNSVPASVPEEISELIDDLTLFLIHIQDVGKM